MNPTTTPTRPRHTSQLPPGITPGPVTIPHQPPTSAQPATWQQPPATTAQHLYTLLSGNGLTGLYACTYSNVAVISLPKLTIWIRPATLTWTHHGRHTTWPTYDLPGAARHLTRLTQHPTSAALSQPPRSPLTKTGTSLAKRP
jgi:hypothetical protein